MFEHQSVWVHGQHYGDWANPEDIAHNWSDPFSAHTSLHAALHDPEHAGAEPELTPGGAEVTGPHELALQGTGPSHAAEHTPLHAALHAPLHAGRWSR